MWWLIIIPVISIVALYYLYPHKMAWFEYIIPIGVSLIVIIIINAVCDYAMSYDKEFHGGWVIESTWDEHWTETYTETETYTDSDGKSQTRLVTKTRYHPDVYSVTDSNGYTVYVDDTHYNYLVSKFGNSKEDNPWHVGQSSWGDGRRFTTTWSGKTETFTPCFTSHRYENRVAHSHSVFNFKNVSKKEKEKFGIYEYPEFYNFYSQQSILGWNDPVAQNTLTIANAKLGAIKQVRIFILVFHNKPLESGMVQQQYWKNGNKNEVVICIGSKNGKIDWVYPFAWDNEQLLVDLREDISQQGNVDMRKIVNTTIALVEKDFKRKSFKEFEYIKLDPPLWAVLIAFFINIFVNIAVAYVVINNEVC